MFVLGAMLFFRHVLFFGSVIPWDLQGFHLPHSYIYADAIARGELPLWDPSTYCGRPFQANIQTQVFYPTVALAAWIGAIAGREHLFFLLELNVILHTILAGMMAFRLGRVLEPAAALGAAAGDGVSDGGLLRHSRRAHGRRHGGGLDSAGVGFRDRTDQPAGPAAGAPVGAGAGLVDTRRTHSTDGYCGSQRHATGAVAGLGREGALEGGLAGGRVGNRVGPVVPGATWSNLPTDPAQHRAVQKRLAREWRRRAGGGIWSRWCGRTIGACSTWRPTA